jgi:hypothetical protein
MQINKFFVAVAFAFVAQAAGECIEPPTKPDFDVTRVKDRLFPNTRWPDEFVKKSPKM